MSLPAIIALLALLPFAALPALAADEPEVVYAKFHRAAMSGNLEELLKYGLDARRAELGSMSTAQKEATLKMAASMMPRAFTLRSKQLGLGGRSARLVVSGMGENIIGGRPEMLYGEVSMVLERGEWKVDESSWSNEQPQAPLPARPAAAPAPAAARAVAPKPATRPAAAAPIRALGPAKPPCVYKPVMTAEDVENCR
ncbi:MAG: hypothetical protein ABI654_11815 [Betaproteobacteria bacterium]